MKATSAGLVADNEEIESFKIITYGVNSCKTIRRFKDNSFRIPRSLLRWHYDFNWPIAFLSTSESTGWTRKDEFARTIGQQAVDDELEISELANQRDAAVFRDCIGIKFPNTVDRLHPITAEQFRKAGSKMPEEAVEELTRSSSRSFRYAQAYCGWLVNQAEYWSDLERVVSNEHVDSRHLSAPMPATLHGGDLPIASEEHGEDIRNYKCFYGKWRLQTLVTHDLPLCISPQLSATNVYDVGSPEGTINPTIPDIFPIDGKGMVSSALEAASRSVQAPHLDSWKNLICSTSHKKKRLDTYRRQFVFQHYWRVLTQRYRESLCRKKECIGQNIRGLLRCKH